MGMRSVVLLGLSACAVADAPPVEEAHIARVLYLDRCAEGCLVEPGADDARTNHSSIVGREVLLEQGVGDAAWPRLVACMQRMFAPYDLAITDVDPGTAPHFELIFGGRSTDVGLPETAAGMAPSTCPSDVADNRLAFVFAQQIVELDVLCWAGAQEVGHLFGLDHVTNRFDPMSWIAPPIVKTSFQDTASECGESASAPRWCQCNRELQNSHQLLLAVLGPRKNTR